MPHRLTSIFALALCSLPLSACASKADEATATVATEGDLTSLDAAAPALKSTDVVVTMGAAQHRFRVEVAASEAEQSRGLMYRTELAPDAGMLFPFPAAKIASFWMKNTLIPLDILFVRGDGSLDRIAENTTPGSLEPVVSGAEVAAVLELPGGTAARLGIDETARVTWTLPR